MNIRKLVVTDYNSNCYIITSQDNNECIIIDPGGEAERIEKVLDNEECIPKAIINTHGHADHIGANAALRERFPDIKIYVGSEDAKALVRPIKNLSIFFGYRIKSPPADVLLNEGDVIEEAGIKLRVITIAGHTKGGICLYYETTSESGPVLFSGDVLFNLGIGRSDFPGGSHKKLIAGIKNKLFTLPGNTIVYPGHGPDTTIQNERENNPFFSESS